MNDYHQSDVSASNFKKDEDLDRLKFLLQLPVMGRDANILDEIDNLVEALAPGMISNSLSMPKRQTIYKAMKFVQFSRDEVIFKQGDEANGCYYVLCGTVSVHKSGEHRSFQGGMSNSNAASRAMIPPSRALTPNTRHGASSPKFTAPVSTIIPTPPRSTASSSQRQNLVSRNKTVKLRLNRAQFGPCVCKLKSDNLFGEWAYSSVQDGDNPEPLLNSGSAVANDEQVLPSGHSVALRNATVISDGVFHPRSSWDDTDSSAASSVSSIPTDSDSDFSSDGSDEDNGTFKNSLVSRKSRNSSKPGRRSSKNKPPKGTFTPIKLLFIPQDAYLVEANAVSNFKSHIQRKINFLQRFKIFELWPTDALTLLATNMRSRANVLPGTQLIKLGKPCKFTYFLIRGEVKVSAPRLDPQHFAIMTAKKNEKGGRRLKRLLEGNSLMSNLVNDPRYDGTMLATMGTARFGSQKRARMSAFVDVALLGSGEILGITEMLESDNKNPQARRMATCLKEVECLVINNSVMFSIFKERPDLREVLDRVAHNRCEWELLAQEYSAKFPNFKIPLSALRNESRIMKYSLKLAMISSQDEKKKVRMQQQIQKMLRYARVTQRHATVFTQKGFLREAGAALEHALMHLDESLSIAKDCGQARLVQSISQFTHETNQHLEEVEHKQQLKLEKAAAKSRSGSVYSSCSSRSEFTTSRVKRVVDSFGTRQVKAALMWINENSPMGHKLPIWEEWEHFMGGMRRASRSDSVLSDLTAPNSPMKLSRGPGVPSHIVPLRSVSQGHPVSQGRRGAMRSPIAPDSPLPMILGLQKADSHKKDESLSFSPVQLSGRKSVNADKRRQQLSRKGMLCAHGPSCRSRRRLSPGVKVLTRKFSAIEWLPKLQQRGSSASEHWLTMSSLASQQSAPVVLGHRSSLQAANRLEAALHPAINRGAGAGGGGGGGGEGRWPRPPGKKKGDDGASKQPKQVAFDEDSLLEPCSEPTFLTAVDSTWTDGHSKSLGSGEDDTSTFTWGTAGTMSSISVSRSPRSGRPVVQIGSSESLSHSSSSSSKQQVPPRPIKLRGTTTLKVLHPLHMARKASSRTTSSSKGLHFLLRMQSV